VITFIIIIFADYIILNKVVKSRFIEKLTIIGNEIAKTSTISILLHDKKIIEMRTTSYLSDRDIIGIKIYKKNRLLFYSVGKDKGKYIDFPIKINLNLNNRAIGNVRIFYTEKYYKEKILKIFGLLSSITFLGFLIISLIVYRLIKKWIGDPLKTLIEYIKELQKGKFDINIRLKGIPEIEMLAEAFQNMTKALDSMNKKLKKSYEIMAQQKTLADMGKFGMMVAHEIKNPLGIIKGAVQVYKKENIDEDTKIEMLNYIEDEVSRIDSLIKDFMNITKLKKPVFEEVNLKRFFDNLIEKFRIEKSGINFKIYISEDVNKITDEQILNYIFFNLIKNSIEANADTVEIKYFENDEFWKINIKDNGEGMDKDTLKNIFEPFYTTKSTGTGLGLVIVNNYVKLLNGQINVKSEKNKGTEFEIIFSK